MTTKTVWACPECGWDEPDDEGESDFDENGNGDCSYCGVRVVSEAAQLDGESGLGGEAG